MDSEGETLISFLANAGISFKISKIYFFTFSLGVTFFLHLEQRVLINLWAITTLKVEGIKKGRTPISINLGITPTAELVWSVDNTMCPVRAALITKPAVSSSLTSPTIIILGSCRKIC